METCLVQPAAYDVTEARLHELLEKRWRELGGEQAMYDKEIKRIKDLVI
jgi:hypothetical protein